MSRCVSPEASLSWLPLFIRDRHRHERRVDDNAHGACGARKLVAASNINGDNMTSGVLTALMQGSGCDAPPSKSTRRTSPPLRLTWIRRLRSLPTSRDQLDRGERGALARGGLAHPTPSSSRTAMASPFALGRRRQSERRAVAAGRRIVVTLPRIRAVGVVRSGDDWRI